MPKAAQPFDSYGEKMKGIYKFAEKTIEVESLYKGVHEYCADYRCEYRPDLSVKITPEDIEYERKRSAQTDIAEGRSVVEYPDDYLEELAVYRKICEEMPFYDTFLFHGSVIAVNGEAYLFTAKSGTGKSTHTRLWRKLLGDKAVMVNDDKPLLKVGERVVAYGTPYNGKHGLGQNIAVPLKAICLLERAKENSITKITKAQAYDMLLQQAYRPMTGAALKKTLELIDKTAEKTALYRLGCNMDISAAETAYYAMSGEEKQV